MTETSPELPPEAAPSVVSEITPEVMPSEATPPETAPEISFEEAIAFTQILMAQIEQSEVSEPELAERLAALVSTEDGARGFFVTYLTDERSLADHPSTGILQALQTSPTIVAELLVKNLAMSSAMAVAHRRNQNEDMALGSDRVRSRTFHLIQQLSLPLVMEKAQQLHESATTGTGVYKTFLDRWGYDAEQRQVIREAVEQVAVTPPPAEEQSESSGLNLPGCIALPGQSSPEH